MITLPVPDWQYVSLFLSPVSGKRVTYAIVDRDSWEEVEIALSPLESQEVKTLLLRRSEMGSILQCPTKWPISFLLPIRRGSQVGLLVNRPDLHDIVLHVDVLTHPDIHRAIRGKHPDCDLTYYTDRRMEQDGWVVDEVRLQHVKRCLQRYGLVKPEELCQW